MDAYISRPATLSIDTLARGDIVSRTLEVRALGGTVGCYSFDYEESPDLKAGEQYAFFLAPSLTADGTIDASTVSINNAWFVDNGVVETAVEGKVAIAAFLAAFEAAPVSPLSD